MRFSHDIIIRRSSNRIRATTSSSSPSSISSFSSFSSSSHPSMFSLFYIYSVILMMVLIISLVYYQPVNGQTFIKFSVDKMDTNGGCDFLDDCDIECPSNSYLYGGGYSVSISLPEKTDNNYPTWTNEFTLVVSNVIPNPLTIQLSCDDNDKISVESFSLKTYSVNAYSLSTNGVKTSLTIGGFSKYVTQTYVSFTITCANNYYGPACATYCAPNQAVASCNSDGSMVCTIYYTGTTCSTCASPYTGTNCRSCINGYFFDGTTCNLCSYTNTGSVCYTGCTNSSKVCCTSHTGVNCNIKKTCPNSLTPPANAGVTFTSYEFSSFCTVACNPGYSGGQVKPYCIISGSGVAWDTALAATLTCTDINECLTGTHACNQTCSNTDGSYTCSCGAGYYMVGNGRGDGGCANLNECSQSDKGGCQQTCIDTPGSYYCSCITGYVINSDGKTCRDKNECTEGGHTCSPDATCVNSIGGYSCNCNAGFSGNGEVCEDINECLASPCDPAANCTNLVNSFSCECGAGYVGDGMTCIPTSSVSFVASSVSVTTPEGPGQITVQLFITSSPIRDDSTISFSLSGTALNGVDYYSATLSPITLTRAVYSKAIEIVILDDEIPEGIETITVTLINPAHLSIGALSTATIRIDANDNSNGVIQFTSNSRTPRADIANGGYQLTVERAGFTVNNFPITVTIQTNSSVASPFDVVIPASQSAVTFPIALPPSSTPTLEQIHSFTITNAVCTGCVPSTLYVGINRLSTVTINAHDDPYGLFVIDVLSAEVPEGTPYFFKVKRLKGTIGTTSIRVKAASLSVAAANDQALASAEDFEPLNTVLTFNDGDIEQVFAIQVVDDSIPEVLEVFGITITVVSGKGRVDPIANSTIIFIPENDNARGVLAITPKLLCFEEPTSVASQVVGIEVTRSFGTFGVIQFSYSLGNGKYQNTSLSAANTAVGNQDFVAVESGTISILEGVASTIIPITVNRDSIPELDEFFFITIFNPSPGLFINSAFNFTNLCIGQNNHPYGLLGFAPVAYSIGSGNNKRLLVSEGSMVSFIILRTFGTFESISAQVTLNHESTDNNDFDSFVVSQTVTFAPGQTNTTVSWAIALDDLDESTEFFNVQLLPDGASSGFEATDFDALNERNISCAIDISNNQYGVIRFNPSQYTVTENTAFVNITVERIGGGASSVGCNFTIIPDSASTGDFIAPVSNTITIPAGKNSTTISIGIVDDSIPESDESFSIALSSVTGGAQLSFGSLASVTISANDDVFGVIAFAPSPSGPQYLYSVNEKNGSISLTVYRSVSQVSTVSVSFALTTNVAQYAAVQALPAVNYPAASLVTDVNTTAFTTYTLTFGNGQSSAQLVIPIINDAVSETTEKVYIVLLNPTGGARLGSLSAIALLIIDDDDSGTSNPQNEAASSSVNIAAIGGGAGGFLVLLVLLILVILFLRRKKRKAAHILPKQYNLSSTGFESKDMVPMTNVAGLYTTKTEIEQGQQEYQQQQQQQQNEQVYSSRNSSLTYQKLPSQSSSLPPPVPGNHPAAALYGSAPPPLPGNHPAGSSYDNYGTNNINVAVNALAGTTPSTPPPVNRDLKSNYQYAYSIARPEDRNPSSYEYVDDIPQKTAPPSLYSYSTTDSYEPVSGLRGHTPEVLYGGGPALPPRTNHTVPAAPRRVDTTSPTYAPIEKHRGDLELQKQLGSGAFGEVYLGLAPLPWFGAGAAHVPAFLIVPNKNIYANKTAAPNAKVAVKILKENADEKAKRDFISEVECMRQFNHRNIVSFIAMFNETQPWMAVLEFLPYGDLINVLSTCKQKNIPPTYSEQLYILFQIASGMEYLDSKKFIHRDLAARNCLVGGDLVVKVADFGLSHQLGEEKDYYRIQTSGKLPFKWMSPEFIHFRKSSSASDVWSYGVLMWEVFTCCDPPYGDMNPVDILTMIEKGQRMPMPNTLQDPDIYQNLTLKCWEYNEQDRPNFSAIVQDLSNRISTNPTSTPIRDLGALSQEN